jgi:general secretion pathway protein G
MAQRSSRPRALRSSGGFSLMEIVIAVSIIAILAASVTPFVNGMVERSKVAKTLTLVDTLRTACSMYHADTGAYAREYAGSVPGNRRLSTRQTIAGWSGPYLEETLRHQTSNPFGGNLHLYGTVTANGWISGFDIDGDGVTDVTGDANMLWLSQISEAVAERLDQALDGNLEGDWKITGRLRYDADNGYAFILVYR